MLGTGRGEGNLNSDSTFWKPSQKYNFRKPQGIGKRLLAVSLLWSLLGPSLGWAFEVSVPMWGNSAPLSPLRLPSQLGSLIASHPGKTPEVIYIQDLHGNPEVQKNIAAILRILANERNVQWVGVEGASVKLDIKELAGFPVAAVREEVGGNLLADGSMTGSEYFAATLGRPVHLEGVERKSLYEENLSVARQLLTPECQGILEDLWSVLAELQKTINGPVLRELDVTGRAFRASQISLSQYATLLWRTGQRHGVPLNEFSSLIDPRASQGLDNDRLKPRVIDLERKIRTFFCRTAGERDLENLSGTVKILERLLASAATTEDLKGFRLHPEKFSPQVILDNLRKYPAVDLEELEIELPVLASYLDKVRRFYELADARSQSFVDNLIERNTGKENSTTALVAGGYHAEGILQALREKGLAYACIRPRQGRPDAPNSYYSLLRGNGLPWEKALARYARFLSPESHCIPGSSKFALLSQWQNVLLKTSYFLRAVHSFNSGAYGRCRRFFQHNYSDPHPAIQVTRDSTSGRVNLAMEETGLPLVFFQAEPGAGNGCRFLGKKFSVHWANPNAPANSVETEKRPGWSYLVSFTSLGALSYFFGKQVQTDNHHGVFWLGITAIHTMAAAWNFEEFLRVFSTLPSAIKEQQKFLEQGYRIFRTGLLVNVAVGKFLFHIHRVRHLLSLEKQAEIFTRLQELLPGPGVMLIKFSQNDPRQDELISQMNELPERIFAILDPVLSHLPPPVTNTDKKHLVIWIFLTWLNRLEPATVNYAGETLNHLWNVAVLMASLAATRGKPVMGFFVDAITHDLGKALVPMFVLHWMGAFQGKQRLMINLHASLTWKILKHYEYLGFDPLVADHHLTLTPGKGYSGSPDGTILPAGGKIAALAVADVVSALIVEKRTYLEKPFAVRLDILTRMLGNPNEFSPEWAKLVMGIKDYSLVKFLLNRRETVGLWFSTESNGLMREIGEDVLGAIRGMVLRNLNRLLAKLSKWRLGQDRREKTRPRMYRGGLYQAA